MKKEQNRSVYVLIMLVLTGVSALAATLIRVHQYLSCLDPETGFWATVDWTKPALLGTVAFVAVLTLLLSFLNRKNLLEPEFPEEKDVTLGVTGLLLAAGFAWDCIVTAKQTVLAYEESGASIYGTATMISSLLRNGFFSDALQVLFGICSVIYFICYTVSLFKGTSLYQNRKLLALCPALWGVSRMLGHFVEPVSYRNLSQLWLELLMLAAAIIFYFSFARIASDVEAEKSMWILYFSGTAGAFLGFTCSAAPFVLTVTGQSGLIPADRPMQYVDLAFAIFATAVLLHYLEFRWEEDTETAEEDFTTGTMPAPAKLFTEEPASAVLPSAAAGDKTIPTDHLTVENTEPVETVLTPKE